jgi:putative sigma-54 modulation protein
MKVTYTGKTKDFTPQLEKKVEEKLAKLAKMIEQRGEKEAHVCHRQERHLHKVDIKTMFYDHTLLGVGEDADIMMAVCQAIEKLEKQIVKLRTRWRDTHRDPKATRAQKESLEEAAPAEATVGSATAAAPVNGKTARPKVYRVDYDDGHKPMTLEEAILEMESNADYFVYQDLDRSRLSVLLRRRDGHFDLIEA